MNLYDAINSHHVNRQPETVAGIRKMVEVAKGGTLVQGTNQLSIDLTSVAILITYHGNVCTCLSNEEYDRFFAILSHAKENLECKIRLGPTTAKVVNAVNPQF